MANIDWQSATQQILDLLDLRNEYAALGVDITGASPNGKGWVACRAVGRDDRNPSAGVNLSGEHPTKGRYNDFVENNNLSFFEAAAEFGSHADWQAARRHYAEKAGVELPEGRQKEPDAQLHWRDYNASLVRLYCTKKPGVTEPSIRAAGGRLASYPKKKRDQDVICLPVYGEAGVEGPIINWWMWRQNGDALNIWQGNDRKPLHPKAAGQSDMPGGWVGQWGLSNLETAEVVWKTEGIPDLLALQAAIGAAGGDLVRRHVVITNSNGCNSVLDERHLRLLEGKRVFVAHDADTPGQKGAVKWCNALACVAKEVRNVTLPYEVGAKHGKDVRDFLTETK